MFPLPVSCVTRLVGCGPDLRVMRRSGSFTLGTSRVVFLCRAIGAASTQRSLTDAETQKSLAERGYVYVYVCVLGAETPY